MSNEAAAFMAVFAMLALVFVVLFGGDDRRWGGYEPPPWPWPPPYRRGCGGVLLFPLIVVLVLAVLAQLG